MDFLKNMRNYLKDRIAHKIISLEVKGKKKSILLYTFQKIANAQKYKFNDRKKDVITELSEYTGETFTLVEQKMKEADANIETEFSATNRTQDEEISDFYSKTKNYIYHLMRTSYEFKHLTKRANTAVSACNYFNKKKVADFGGGSGRDGIIFARMGYSVTHVDIPGVLSDFATWRYGQRGLKVNVITPETFKGSNEKYDVIMCFDVLEHILDPDKWLATFYDKLNNNGLFLFFGDFDNLNTRLHLKENYNFINNFNSLVKKAGFICLGNPGISIYLKNSKPATSVPI